MQKTALFQYSSNPYSQCVTATYCQPPFGMLIKERSYTSDSYRFGFNGMEKIDELNGEGNSLDFGARIYDSRLARWLSIDPHWKNYSSYSTYLYAINNPLYWKDVDGRDIVTTVAFNTITATKTRLVVLAMINDETTEFSKKYLSKYYGEGQRDLIITHGYVTPDNNPETHPAATKSNPLTNKTGITFNVLAEIIQTEATRKGSNDGSNYVLTNNGIAASFIHEVIYHADNQCKVAGHIISTSMFEDAVKALMEYNSSITKEQAVAVMASGMGNELDLLEFARTNLGITLDKEKAQSLAFDLFYDVEYLPENAEADRETYTITDEEAGT